MFPAGCGKFDPSHLTGTGTIHLQCFSDSELPFTVTATAWPFSKNNRTFYSLLVHLSIQMKLSLNAFYDGKWNRNFDIHTYIFEFQVHIQLICKKLNFVWKNIEFGFQETSQGCPIHPEVCLLSYSWYLWIFSSTLLLTHSILSQLRTSCGLPLRKRSIIMTPSIGKVHKFDVRPMVNCEFCNMRKNHFYLHGF